MGEYRSIYDYEKKRKSTEDALEFVVEKMNADMRARQKEEECAEFFDSVQKLKQQQKAAEAARREAEERAEKEAREAQREAEKKKREDKADQDKEENQKRRKANADKKKHREVAKELQN